MTFIPLDERLAAVAGGRVAAVDEQGAELTYAELVDAAKILSKEIGEERSLVLLEGGNTFEWFKAYVAALIGRHPVLIAPSGADAAMAHLESVFAPQVRITAATGYRPVATGAAGTALHPDLAVMLSTSGSTGSAKCVRLSRANIAANAESIVEYLGLGPDERGLVSLPTHYSYGLSIVNSHIAAGATLLLTSRSVIEPEFWAFAEAHGATSFAGVPHSYELLRRLDLGAKAPSSLRYFTQAGGKMPAEAVRHFAEFAKARGVRFFVMYGQTEATARMAYLPPDMALDHSDCIGQAIPGGRFTILGDEGQEIREPGISGELIYEGPNVMMGYAQGPDDLALGAGPKRLPTGDIAEWDVQPIVRIVGRISRFIKVFGNRIGLDDVEQLLASQGVSAIATGVDEHLLVVTRDAASQAAITDLVRDRLKIPASHLTVQVVDEYPLLSSGKVDLASLKASLDAPAPTARARPWWALRGRKSETPMGVGEAFVAVFGASARDEGASFNSLGGDSLTYVTMAMRLEDVIPDVPEDWGERSIGSLIALAHEQAGTKTQRKTGSGALSRIDSVRGLACLLVVAFHVVGASTTDGMKLPMTSGWHYAMDSLQMIRMPLFTAMSGYLYGALPAALGGYGVFVQRKARQLLVPAVFATLVFWGLRQVVYKRHDSLLWAYIGGYQHLWYLPTLLMIFVFVGLVDTIFRSTWRTLLTIMVVAPIVNMLMPTIPILHIKNTVFLLPFFAFGLLLYRKPELLKSKALVIASIVAAVGVLLLQQLAMNGYPISGHLGPLPWLCGFGALVVLLRFFPKIVWLEWVAGFSFTIYLWHPAANGFTRALLYKAGVHANWAIFCFGLVAGVLAPIGIHLIAVRFPKLSLPLIGR